MFQGRRVDQVLNLTRLETSENDNLYDVYTSSPIITIYVLPPYLRLEPKNGCRMTWFVK